jgi:maltooligosyltrehalose trehalohydrolase
LYAPYHGYGGPDGLKRLVDALHQSGIAVLLDVVYNHLGPSGNYLSQYGPYFTDRFRTPWGEAVNFCEAGSDEVRNYFIDNAVMWLRDYHFDGLRLDAVHAIMDTSAVHFLEELAVRVRDLEGELGRPLWLIAESDWNDPRVIRPIEAGGYGLSAQWSDDYHHAIHTVLTGERSGYYADFGTLRQLAKAIEKGFVYDGQHSVYRGRRHGRELDPALKSKLICCLQNHDQIGNRATGNRITSQMSMDRVKIGAALVLLGPFTPLLFQGEEWGASTPFAYFTNHQEAELARAVSEGRRREFAAFGWFPASIPDPQDRATFERSKLNWAEAAESPHREMLEWYRQLIALRRNSRELQSTEAKVTLNEAEEVLVMQRGGIAVMCNFSSCVRTVRPGGGADLLLRSSADTMHQGDASVLSPSSVTVVAVRSEAPALSAEAEFATA